MLLSSCSPAASTSVLLSTQALLDPCCSPAASTRVSPFRWGSAAHLLLSTGAALFCTRRSWSHSLLQTGYAKTDLLESASSTTACGDSSPRLSEAWWEWLPLGLTRKAWQTTKTKLVMWQDLDQRTWQGWGIHLSLCLFFLCALSLLRT